MQRSHSASTRRQDLIDGAAGDLLLFDIGTDHGAEPASGSIHDRSFTSNCRPRRMNHARKRRRSPWTDITGSGTATAREAFADDRPRRSRRTDVDGERQQITAQRLEAGCGIRKATNSLVQTGVHPPGFASKNTSQRAAIIVQRSLALW